MSDPFEMLRSPNRRAEPDPEFRARLTALVDRAIDTAQAVPAPNPIQQMTLSEVAQERPTGDGRPRRSFILMVAAAAVIIALTAVILVRDRDAAPLPVYEQPSTVPFDPARESEIAESMLLDAEEYAPGWTSLPFKEVVLDGSLVETVPGCAPFLDTVFESSRRAAVTDYRHFMFFNPAAFDTQYVVVFPSEAAAEAMFDGTVDPRFGDGCLQPYRELTAEFDGWCCDSMEPTTPWLSGEPIESDAEAVGADDVQLRVDDDWFFTDEAGVVHGPEQMRSVTLRVGRAIIVMDATTRTESGESPITVEQFDTAITNAVNQARDALDQSDN